MNEATNDYIARLRHDALKMFPGATSVEIFINEEEVSVTPSYRGQLGPFKSVRTIDGAWRSKQEGRVI